MANIISNFESLSKEDFLKYAGEWIIVIDEKVVAHSKSFKEMYLLAKEKYTNKKPLIGKIPKSNLLALCS